MKNYPLRLQKIVLVLFAVFACVQCFAENDYMPIGLNPRTYKPRPPMLERLKPVQQRMKELIPLLEELNRLRTEKYISYGVDLTEAKKSNYTIYVSEKVSQLHSHAFDAVKEVDIGCVAAPWSKDPKLKWWPNFMRLINGIPYLVIHQDVEEALKNCYEAAKLLKAFSELDCWKENR